MSKYQFDSTPIYQLIAHQALENPNKIAIKYIGKSITYSELIKASNQFASFMAQKSVKRNEIIIVAMDRSIDMVIAMIGLLKSGITYLPILPDYPKDRLNYILENSNTSHIFSAHKYKAQYGEYSGAIFVEEFLEVKDSLAEMTDDGIDHSEDTAFALYTSGSTGLPKGVEIAQKSFLNHLLSMQLVPGITKEDIVLNITTITFDIAQLELFLPLISGAQLFITDMDESRDGRLLLETIEKEQITIVQATPFNWQILIESGWQKKMPFKALCGGEALSMDLAQKLCSRVQELWNVYGPTEATIWATVKQIQATDPIITIGKPMHNVDVYILNEQLQEMPVDEVGEIYISGIQVGKGYINRPELTEKAFLNDPISSVLGTRMYKTGDLGKKLANGEIQCLGRIDHQIKIRGNRVETEEIEFQIKQYENVKNAIVVGHKDHVDNMRLVAYVELEKAIPLADEAHLFKSIKASLGTTLPEYMIPTDYMIILEVPLMSNGKVNRKALPAPVLQVIDRDIIAAETELEKRMLSIWSRNLGMDQISVVDNFFDLGGNSLIATKIMLQVEQETGKRLPNATLFQYQSIRALCKVIESNIAESPYKVLVPMKPTGTKMPIYIVHAIGLNLMFLRNVVQLMDVDQPVYGLQALGLNGIDEPLDNMEAIARYYNSEILMHNPKGPYIIAGYSFGGYIAWEMVRQLKEMGKDVRMLAMMDTNIQEPLYQQPLAERIAKKLFRQWKKMVFRLGTSFSYPADTWDYLKTIYTHRYKKLLDQNFDSENMPVFMMRIADKMEHAYYHYQFKAQHIKIDQFISEKRMFFIDDPKTMGWKNLALDGIEQHLLPGDHKDMLFPPNDRIFAQTLQKKLDQLNQELANQQAK